MADVGVRELKRRLSEYLDRAERGEVLRVTDRGRPKAILAPLPDREDPVARGIREGWITPGTGGPLPPIKPWRSKRRVLDVLAEDRGD
jgi:prevent-host-death family protein